MHDDDRLLRERLRGADPARDLAPLPPMWLDHRMEQIMSDQKPAARPAIRRWMPVAGIAAALAIAAAIVAPLALGTRGPTVESLALPDGGGTSSASCLPVSVDTLRAQEQAFAARALSVEADRVVLEVTERFSGEIADRVEVPQVDRLTSDFSSEPFEVGESYLVAATDGVMLGCGHSGADTAELRALYDGAFPG